VAEPFSYDVVEYPSAPLPQVHPGHLYAVARLYGLDPAPVGRCRYLEVGCGDGAHLIACAYGLPDATFVGIDLSAVAVERGNRVIAGLGLSNVKLYAADLTKWEPPGRFDYAMSHGCYSWIPAPVRDGLLALIARSLNPTGVGYVSYNAYPGCFIRRMVWEMLKHHTAAIDDPAEKSAQALEFVKFLHAGQPEKPGPELATFAKELQDILDERQPGLLYHDDLSDTNEPVYFHQFAAHAARFGLRFVAEAEQNVMATRALPRNVADVLDGMADRDVLDKEQYLDYLRIRRFRQTLLSPDGRTPQKEPDPGRVTALAVSGKPKPDPDPCDLAPGVAVTFTTKNGAAARTDLAIAKAALTVLPARWPGRVPFPELVRLAASALGREPTPEDSESLANLLTRVWQTGLVELHGHVPRYAAAVSERPVASPLARMQLQTGPLAATVFLTPMLFDDAPSRRLVQLLDGTRTKDQIAAELLGAFPEGNRPDPAALRAGIEQRLERMAHGGLLVG
jgi:hypothetical protein